MRTNIEIDDRLMRDAMAAGGTLTKRDTVEAGLRLLVKVGAKRRVLELRGIGWEGDLDAMRTAIDP